MVRFKIRLRLPTAILLSVIPIPSLLLVAVATAAAVPVPSPPPPPPPSPIQARCPDYASYAYGGRHEPYSAGRRRLPYQRPRPECRTFRAAEVEAVIEEMRGVVRDPDLFRLFENCWPNTLDTAIAWRGVAANQTGEEEEELTFITTGDISAMWLRDSANQLHSYAPLLQRASRDRDSLASLFRGAINLQARYLLAAPYCNAFRAPAEAAAGMEGQGRSASSFPPPSRGGGGGGGDFVTPPFPWAVVHECKWELDSPAAFLQLSHDYFRATGDVGFSARRRSGDSTSGGSNSSSWVAAVEQILATAEAMRGGTYSEDDDGDEGKVNPSPYRFQRHTPSATETLPNGGAGSPVRGGTGLVRSAFRPSDDACTYQLFVPGNMMLARYLAACAEIADAVEAQAQAEAEAEVEERIGAGGGDPHSLAQRMLDLAEGVRLGVERHGRVRHAVHGDMYAYEVDGFGSHNVMDDANIPSLLAAPLIGYVDRADPVYRNTRRFALSRDNPYYMRGPVMNATGGPHVGTGMAWPMGLITQILTEDSDEGAIVSALRQLLASTDSLGLMHESVDARDAAVWTRPWFAWANGLFGQMVLDLRERQPHILAMSFQ